MKALLATLLLALAVCNVHAMSIVGYERTKAMADAPGPNRNMAKISLDSYFQGIAESLIYLQAGSQRIYVEDRPFLCFHTNVNLTGALLRGVLDGELTSPAVFSETLGPSWKEYQIPAILFPALLRLYPCTK